MNKPKPLIALILTAGLIFPVCSTTAYAMGGGSENSKLSITPATATSPATTEAAVPFAAPGNLTLVDDPQKAASPQKQFITVKTKEGDTFYIVVDRAGNQENVYFMNLVDDADLKALIKKDPLTDSPLAKGIVQPSADPGSKPTTTSAKAEVKEPKKSGISPAVLLLLLLLPAGGAALWFFKYRSPKPQVKGATDLDDYDFDDEEDEPDTVDEDNYAETDPDNRERDSQ